MAAKERGRQGHQFVEAGGAAGKVSMEKTEVLKSVVDALLELELSFRVLVAKRLLHVTEEATGARDGKGHGAEFAKDLMPPLDRCAPLGERYLCQDVGKSLQAAGW